jgi:hypothetical protein
MQRLLLILLLGCAACTSQAQDPERKTAASAPAAPGQGDTLARIRALAADASCSDHSQCRSLPIGHLACGGPQSYLAYSTLKANENTMRELGERYKAQRQAKVVKRGEVSTCRFNPDPGAVCVSGTCQLGASSPAAPTAR